MELKNDINAYLNNKPALNVCFPRSEEEHGPINIVFQGEGDFFLLTHQSKYIDVCPGCGSKTSWCPTWGTCDWEKVNDDELDEKIEELTEYYGSTPREVSRAE